jgi:hypothetical protein
VIEVLRVGEHRHTLSRMDIYHTRTCVGGQ